MGHAKKWLAEGLGTFHSSREAFAAYRNTVEKAVERGHIRVIVPQARIRLWKAQCAAEVKPGDVECSPQL